MSKRPQACALYTTAATTHHLGHFLQRQAGSKLAVPHATSTQNDTEWKPVMCTHTQTRTHARMRRHTRAPTHPHTRRASNAARQFSAKPTCVLVTGVDKGRAHEMSLHARKETADLHRSVLQGGRGGLPRKPTHTHAHTHSHFTYTHAHARLQPVSGCQDVLLHAGAHTSL